MEKKFENKPNNGALLAVKSKKNPAQPDYRGELLIDLKTFPVENNMIKISLSGWKKSWTGGVYLSMMAEKPWTGEQTQSAPYQRKQEIQDDDIPF